VFRKLAELGYHRSAKKCKEKFENVYKYHKRTKESRSGKHEGKTYKFFDQLQALENQFIVSYPLKPQPTLATTNTVALLPPPTRPSDTTTISYVTTTVPSTNPTAISPSPLPPPPTNATTTTTTITSPTALTNPRNPPQPNNNNHNIPYSLPNMNNLFSTTSTSSSTASDEDLEEKYRKKRKWKDYFRRLTRQVLAKQEEMQKRFLEAIDKREREHVAQQEAWRIQEMARINREHELLVQERSTAAAKNAAVIAFLQQLSGQNQNPSTQAGANFLQPPPSQTPPPPQVSQVKPPPQQAPQPQTPLVMSNNSSIEIQKMNNGHSVVAATPTTAANAISVVVTTPTSLNSLSSSRWPKAEVHALIRLRTSLETKYQENGPKAPLWEEISAGMSRLGYNRSAKRCKEKWENINKYFKKVKESNKHRRENSKTCPYFHELDALYKEKSKTQNPFGASFLNMKPHEMMEPLMVQPEQQWRPPSQYEHGAAKENSESEHERKEREEEEEEDDEEVEEDENEEGDLESVEDEGGSRYEIETNKLSSVDAVE